jgi:hypothetical protein
MAILSYVIVHDTGFAPNPYGGFLTLATCKPRIRQGAVVGDWVVGTGSSGGIGARRVVYAARIAEVVPIEDYGREARFHAKIPKASGPAWVRHGDNIYCFVNGRWKQRRNPHHGPEHVARDLSGRNVLVAKEFWYFGQAAPTLPSSLFGIVKRGPGHKKVVDPESERQLRKWLGRFPLGIAGSAVQVESNCDA